MPSELLESTLFGHVKGAFTSAIASKKGLFEVANGGTLFLDEIATMGMDTQAKILRVLQDRRFMHLGGIQEIQVDVRIIAATSTLTCAPPCATAASAKTSFIASTSSCRRSAAPLRDRREDIPLLAAHFHEFYANENGLSAAKALTADALRALIDYGWPGESVREVRKLDRARRRFLSSGTGDWFRSSAVPAPGHITGRSFQDALLEHNPNASLSSTFSRTSSAASSSRSSRRCNWNQTDAAESSSAFPLSTLNQKIKRLNIEIRKRMRE